MRQLDPQCPSQLEPFQQPISKTRVSAFAIGWYPTMKYSNAAYRGRGTRDRTNRNLGEGFPKFSMFMGQHDPVTLLVCTRC